MNVDALNAAYNRLDRKRGLHELARHLAAAEWEAANLASVTEGAEKAEWQKLASRLADDSQHAINLEAEAKDAERSAEVVRRGL